VSDFRPSLESLEDRCLPSATLVQDINPGAADSSPNGLVNVQGQLFFAASDGLHGMELWTSDGTTAGTRLVKDINPGAADSGPANLTAVNGALFFTADDGANGRQLWKSDGTPDGTVLVLDILTNGSGIVPANLTAVNDTLFFTAADPIYPGSTDLWKSDGTPEGTVPLAKAPPRFANPTAVNGTLFFTSYVTGSYGRPPSRFVAIESLCKSDGTSTGIVGVKTLVEASSTTNYPVLATPLSLTNVDGVLYFAAPVAAGGERHLWRSDGTANGTAVVGGPTGVEGIANVNGSVFFAANDGTDGGQLWKSDGTPGGTALLKTLYAGTGNDPTSLTAVGGTLFFRGYDKNGAELWKSDGTAAGTVLVKNIAAGKNSSGPADLTAGGNTVFFSADDGAHGAELWQSDGTAAGTVLVADVNPGSAGSAPHDLTAVGSHLFFAANDGTHGTELWDPPIADAADRVTHYSITDLGTLGGTQTIVSGLNSQGEAAGVSTTARGDSHAFIWRNGVMTDLGTLGGNFSDADLINDSGQIVGVSTTAAGDAHAFLWQRGVMTDLGVADGVGSVGLALNNRGIAVGELDMADGASHTFVADRAGAHDLHAALTLGGASDSAYDINDAGQIVGLAQTAGPDAHAFLYGPGGVQDLGSLAGTWSIAAAVNEDGVVAGTSGVDPAQHAAAGPGGIQSATPLHEHAFVYSRGRMDDLTPAGGFTESQGNWVDPDGRVFGSSSTLAQDDFAATVWNHGIPTDVNTLFRPPANLVGLGGIAWGNASGQLVGLGLLTSGEVHGFLLTPRGASGELDTQTGGRVDPSDNRETDLNASGQSGRAAENLRNINWSAADLLYNLLADEAARRKKG
jgi:ELWxxDGT repeat protein/probable HAF family extracellular repeat protein